MKKIMLMIVFILFTLSIYAVPPQDDIDYQEIYSIEDALNSTDGVTCIINGTLTYVENSEFNDRYILNDGENEITVHIPNHVKGNITDFSGNYKVVGEIGGAKFPPHIREPHRDKHIDMRDINHNKRNIHIRVRYIEKAD